MNWKCGFHWASLENLKISNCLVEPQKFKLAKRKTGRALKVLKYSLFLSDHRPSSSGALEGSKNYSTFWSLAKMRHPKPINSFSSFSFSFSFRLFLAQTIAQPVTLEELEVENSKTTMMVQQQQQHKEVSTTIPRLEGINKESPWTPSKPRLNALSLHVSSIFVSVFLHFNFTDH